MGRHSVNLKTVCLYGHEGSNPPSSATFGTKFNDLVPLFCYFEWFWEFFHHFCIFALSKKCKKNARRCKKMQESGKINLNHSALGLSFARSFLCSCIQDVNTCRRWSRWCCAQDNFGRASYPRHLPRASSHTNGEDRGDGSPSSRSAWVLPWNAR